MKSLLKMSPGKDCWDKVTLFLDPEESVTSMLRLKNRFSTMELHRQLAIAFFDGHEGKLSIEIDGRQYCWSQEIWEAVLSCTEQWYERYMYLVEEVGN